MHPQKHTKKALLAGGGTGGSVTPLLAIKEELEKEGDFQFLWVGTRTGVEKDIIKGEGMNFRGIICGKLRRYFDLKNLVDPFKIVIGFFQSLHLLLRWRPDIILSAGSFVSVPVAWAGWLLRVPVLIHQQDKRPGLANKLMAPIAAKITVTFEESVSDYKDKAVWTGNPTRTILTQAGGDHNIPLEEDWPVILIVGGGTGSLAINKLVAGSIDKLLKICQVVHITGKNKAGSTLPEPEKRPRYFPYDFLEPERMMAILYRADAVVSRAGLGFLTELSYTGKPSIIIPIPDSHQEDNAWVVKKKKAAIVLDQNKTAPDDFFNRIKSLLTDKELKSRLADNMGKIMKRGGSENMSKVIKEIMDDRY